ncbi:SET domain-containing protein [Micromonospora sp. NPDC000089]|uniref:SET domain-containing protein n=1 Tax=unclassified Micromonospora TaxID=2617518 RepID=UPI00369F3246
MTVPPEPDCWLHPDVEVRASIIAGSGLFAAAPLPAGTVVSRLGGRLVSTDELRKALSTAAGDPGRPYVDTVMIDEAVHLLLPPRRPNGYGNHGCDPNLWWTGPYALSTRRDVAAGEELTNDYATSTGDPGFVLTCDCGSPRCRRTVTGNDWRLAELRGRYGEHWVPGLLARIRTSSG